MGAPEKNGMIKKRRRGEKKANIKFEEGSLLVGWNAWQDFEKRLT